ncbi:MAG: MotA/TolQ/ExbB proton channel family protein [Planctomycetaceae bacterium]|nr:MotA/TolQ/ExbB proton channel family protein [Planctomycetales bacterium]MCB9873743.1 MotA/TolQ/ExbB proton channel family protein [Planctomycetaceae bacterium]MCB9938122.1 MotA/TolQ/ExbB proton channel family protein [Planctomycetaceae bacterium]
MDLNIFTLVGYVIYAILLLIALWGGFCCVMVWRRVAQKRFKNEAAQDDFLDELEIPLSKADFEDASMLCDGDLRAVPQLAHLAILNRGIGFVKVRQLVEDRFQRDILAELEHQMTWVHTVIKSAPMVGLFGTVTGMMGAFDTLATSENVEPAELAANISVALITTACGLAIAIPLIVAVAAVNIRIKKMEELAVAGLNRFIETIQIAMAKEAGRRR